MRELRHVLVTGGAGFLGTHLCARLLAAGSHVVCVDNLATSWPPTAKRLRGRAGLDFVEADIADAPDDPRLLGPFDVVFHLASPASPPDYLRLPLETLRAGAQGTAAALDIAERSRARFVLASTSEVYGDPQVHPQPESYWGHVNPVGPRSVYDEAKRFAEALTFAHRRSRGTDIAIARIFNSYGPGMRPDDGRMVPTFCCQALRDEPITVAGTGEQTRSLCHVSDTVAGLLALAAADITGPVNIGNPIEFTVLRVAELIREHAGSDSPIRLIPAGTDDPQRRCPVIDLAAEELNWEPKVDPAQGLRETVQWFRDELSAAAAGLTRAV
ncbi:NAD-dependent epimerase/dehydratase family protein [Mycolicibacillus trivialis]|uniref:Epimerase n=1 Tax=Mycolicibacillus trivialis TaxID=1798 RepID=A0A1X2EKR3_9MYCO|nr:NAD-dependent epimerase/dehydratase family protein [Mycolicibacillus trivialis]ORX05540.1 epimerase [Mycolicibacillus trivialis]